MDDYTSIYKATTTDEVRTAYEGVYKPRFSGSEMAGPMFDRWLQSVKETAWDEGFLLATRNNPNKPHPMLRMNPYRTEQS